jgi:SpoIID/LytB domain protein
LQADAYGSWTLVEQVPLERYLQGVVPHEIGAGSPAAALAAQAVLARTWALRNRHRFEVDGYHLCSDTQCQVYSDPRQAGSAVRQAVSRTAGQVLAQNGEPIHAVYHASNGGVSADEDEAWPLPELGYLEPSLDLDGASVQGLTLPLDAQEVAALLARRSGVVGATHPLFRWRRQLDQVSLRKGLGARAASLGSPLKPVVLERGPSGRVVRLAIEGPGGRVVLERDAIRRTYRQLPSTLFVLAASGAGSWSVVGGGFGHGSGLSQAGAIELAARGWSVEQILNRYYPGARLVPIQTLPEEAHRGAL